MAEPVVKRGMPTPKVEHAEVEQKSVTEKVDLKFEPKSTVRRNIQVKALRDGFYKQQRIAKGTVFVVTHESQLGTWMQEI